MADHNPTETNDPTQHTASEHDPAHRTASERIDKGAERVKKATSSAAHSTHEAVDHAEAGVERGADKAADAAKYAAEHGGEKWDSAMGYAGDWMDEVRGYVREKPAQSLVIAAAAGWLIGRLIHRR